MNVLSTLFGELMEHNAYAKGPYMFIPRLHRRDRVQLCPKHICSSPRPRAHEAYRTSSYSPRPARERSIAGIKRINLSCGTVMKELKGLLIIPEVTVAIAQPQYWALLLTSNGRQPIKYSLRSARLAFRTEGLAVFGASKTSRSVR